MTIENIKKEMKAYRDLYGGYLIGLEDIDKATSKIELAVIIENHRSHMESMLSDAHSHLDRFKDRVELRIWQMEND